MMLRLHSLALALVASTALASETSQRRVYTAGERYLVVEALDDDLVRFELGVGRPPSGALHASPMIAKTDYPGASRFSVSGRRIETSALRVDVAADLCVSVDDLAHGHHLHRICPKALETAWKGLEVSSPGTRHAYGLGQYFAEEKADGDWLGRVWDPLADGYGSRLRGFAGGANNYSMFPILYALGEGKRSHALFVDSVYKQMWDFRAHPWSIGMWGDQIRWYVLSGPDLPDLRRDYMELTGRPPIPPKRSFGLWVSEFGYESWSEVRRELQSLRAGGFPVDGFAMDLQWFGGTFGDPDNSRMGSLTWDETRFPDPRGEIARLANDEGVRLMLIEEPYISITLEEHRALASRGHLAKACADCGPTFLDYNPWWGRGGMVDFTSPAAGDFWHDYRRKDLVAMGVADHWTDLGEPEQYDARSWYHGFPALGKHAHADVHNIYGFRWIESIRRGYERHGERQRSFLLSRTGTSGIQRFGAGLWSGDIGTNWGNLRSQMNAQMHMALSGVDYYGSDAGGFQRQRGSIEGGTERLYTQWLAASAALDVPVRPHAWNLDKARPTSPSRRGDAASNLDALRLRYRLAPYYYSLAHAAYETGDPVFPPLVHYYQDDPETKGRGDHKLIGRDLLVVLAADAEAASQDVYLPHGAWIDWHSLEWRDGGRSFGGVPIYRDGVFRLPLFARSGAIVPMAHVDELTMNGLGKRRDGSRRDDLIVRVFAAAEATRFEVVEDDGETTDYRAGAVARTVVTQQLAADVATVTIEGTRGRYQGMAAERPFVVELVVRDRGADSVAVDGQPLPACPGAPCYESDARGLIRVDLGRRSATETKQVRVSLKPTPSRGPTVLLTCRDGHTVAGTSVYAVGDVPELGAWDARRAIKLQPVAYPTWSTEVSGLPAGQKVAWKCIKRREDGGGSVTWQAGPNNEVTLKVSGSSGESVGRF